MSLSHSTTDYCLPFGHCSSFQNELHKVLQTSCEGVFCSHCATCSQHLFICLRPISTTSPCDDCSISWMCRLTPLDCRRLEIFPACWASLLKRFITVMSYVLLINDAHPTNFFRALLPMKCSGSKGGWQIEFSFILENRSPPQTHRLTDCYHVLCGGYW